MNVSTTPTLSSDTLPNLTSLQTDLTKKPNAPRAPRVNVEPLYAAVKGSISDADWTIYKKALSFFLLGNLNQEELSQKLSKILTTPALEHAHNALFTAIYANIWRDPPEAGIASWVSSSDKPTSGTVKGTGDESEKRLKHEVMQLSRRERKRLKGIPAGETPLSTGLEGLGAGAPGPVQEYVDARRAKQLDVGPSSNQGGGFGKTSTYMASVIPLIYSIAACIEMLTSCVLRLGTRDSETVHIRPLRRDTRIPHRYDNILSPPTYMLRIWTAPGPHI
jgi:transcriptional coactivator HFI1/ADA1